MHVRQLILQLRKRAKEFPKGYFAWLSHRARQLCKSDTVSTTELIEMGYRASLQQLLLYSAIEVMPYYPGAVNAVYVPIEMIRRLTQIETYAGECSCSLTGFVFNLEHVTFVYHIIDQAGYLNMKHDYNLYREYAKELGMEFFPTVKKLMVVQDEVVLENLVSLLNDLQDKEQLDLRGTFFTGNDVNFAEYVSKVNSGRIDYRSSDLVSEQGFVSPVMTGYDLVSGNLEEIVKLRNESEVRQNCNIFCTEEQARFYRALFPLATVILLKIGKR